MNTDLFSAYWVNSQSFANIFEFSNRRVCNIALCFLDFSIRLHWRTDGEGLKDYKCLYFVVGSE